jgi:hypothetical protein
VEGRLLLIQRDDVVVHTCIWVTKAHPYSREGRGSNGGCKAPRIHLESRRVEWRVGNGDTPTHLGREGVGCEDCSCSFGEQIGWWWVKKSPPIGLEGRGAL